MAPLFSIITPTLQRPSLCATYRSVMAQTFTDWEWMIQVDAEEIDMEALGYMGPTRKIWIESCGQRHNDYGNTCRNAAWERTSGRWAVYLDDDNKFADKNALQRIHDCLVAGGEPDVGIFPIMRHGVRFFHDPPRLCFFDTAQMVVKREIGRWLKIPDYTADGILIEKLVAEHGYTAFPDCEPIISVPVSSEGK